MTITILANTAFYLSIFLIPFGIGGGNQNSACVALGCCLFVFSLCRAIEKMKRDKGE